MDWFPVFQYNSGQFWPYVSLVRIMLSLQDGLRGGQATTELHHKLLAPQPLPLRTNKDKLNIDDALMESDLFMEATVLDISNGLAGNKPIILGVPIRED